MHSHDAATTTEKHDGDLFSIRQMSDAYGITLRALRFYEGRGLIAPVRRGSTRLYDPATRARLIAIERNLVHTVGVDRQSGFEQLQPCPEFRAGG